MKKILISSCICLSMHSMQSQSNFNIAPTNSITTSIDCDSTKELDFFIINPNAFDINLCWKIKFNNLPMENDMNGNGGCWGYMLCDWQLCRFKFPKIDSVILPTKIKPNSFQNEMKLGVIPGSIKGSGTLIIEVFEKNFPTNSKTITWNISACTTGMACTNSIAEQIDNTNFKVFPNPIEDFLNMELPIGYNINASIQIYNLLGEKILGIDDIQNSEQKIDLKKLPVGGYFIKYSVGNSYTVKKVFKANNKVSSI